MNSVSLRGSLFLGLMAVMALSLAPLSAQVTTAGGITNGSFEQPAIAANSQHFNTNIPGWHFTAVGGFQDDGIDRPGSGSPIFPVPNGHQALIIQEATLEQTFGAAAVGNCNFSFKVFVGSLAASTNSVKLFIGSHLIVDLSPTVDHQWVMLSHNFDIAPNSALIGHPFKIVIDQWANPNISTWYDDFQLDCSTSGCLPKFAQKVEGFFQGPGATAGADPVNALGNTPGTQFDAGAGGRIILSFDGRVTTTGDTGPDICIDELGLADCYFVELRVLDAFTAGALEGAGWNEMANGWYRIPGGTFCGDANIEIDALVPGYEEGSLLFTRVRIRDDNSTSPSGDADGYELLTIEAKRVCPTPECVPEFVSRVVASTTGPSNDPSAVASGAIGNNTNTRWSSGVGGEITVGFTNEISNGAGADICIDEFGVVDCYEIFLTPGNAATIGAVNNAGWTQSGFAYQVPNGPYCGDQNIDLDSLLPGFSEGDLRFFSVRLLDDGSAGDGFELVTMEAKFVCPCENPEASLVSVPCGFSSTLDPVLTITNARVGSIPTFKVESVFPGIPGWIYASPGPVTPVNIDGCMFVLDLNAFYPIVTFTTDAQGDFSLNLGVPLPPEITGAMLTFQVRVCDLGGSTPGPFAPLPDFFSNGLMLRIGCP